MCPTDLRLPDNPECILSSTHLEFPRSPPIYHYACAALLNLDKAGQAVGCKERVEGPGSRHPVCAFGGNLHPRTSLLPSTNEGVGQEEEERSLPLLPKGKVRVAV